MRQGGERNATRSRAFTRVGAGALSLGLALLIGFVAPLGDTASAMAVSGGAPVATAPTKAQDSAGAEAPLATQTVGGSLDPATGSTAGGDFATVTLDEAPSFMLVAGGDGFALALTDDGLVAAWGRGTSGQMGNGAMLDALEPVLLPASAFGGEKVVQVAAGSTSSYARTESGAVYAWGAGTAGELAAGSVDASTPKIVDAALFGGEKVVQVVAAAASKAALVRTESGSVYAWGAGLSAPTRLTLPAKAAQLAAGATGSVAIITDAGAVLAGAVEASGAVLVPVDAAALVGTPVSLAVASGQVTVLTDAQRVFTALAGAAFAPVAGVAQATGIVAGEHGALAITGPADTAEVLAWDSVTAPHPIDVTALGDASVTHLAQGATTSYLVAGGAVYAWGSGESGALGTGDTVDHATPVAGVHLDATTVSFSDAVGDGAVATSSTSVGVVTPAHDAGVVDVTVTFVLRAGTVDAADSTSGASPARNGVGDADVAGGVDVSSSVPSNASTEGSHGPAIARVLTQAFTFENAAMPETASLFARGGMQPLGLDGIQAFGLPAPDPVVGSLTPNTGPTTGGTATSITLASGAPKFVQTSGGNAFAVGLTAEGKVYAWGLGASGQLGNGATTTSGVPVAVQIPAGKTIVQVATGDATGYALAADGAVYAWGSGGNGQLGNGTNTASQSTPVVVSTPAGVTQISAGTSTGYALAGGAAYAWGFGTSGQLGNMTNLTSNTPVAVSTSGSSTLVGKTVTQVAGGGTSGYALASDGTVHAWGAGANGRLGNGASSNSNVPVAVSAVGVLSGKTVTQIAAGGSSAYALDSAGAVYSWGADTNGQLGNDTATTDSNIPVAVSTAGVLAGTTVAQVGAGPWSAYALDTAGQAYSWGLNTNGRLGNGNNTQQNTPVAVNAGALPASATIIDVSGGTSGYATGSDGSVYSWGSQTNGALGNGLTAGSSNVPVLGPNARVAPTAGSVQFDGVNATAVSQASPGAAISATTPAHVVGPVNVALTHTLYGGTTVGTATASPLTLYSAFTYVPVAAAPVGVWLEGFENGGADQSWTNGASTTDTGRISVYKGAAPNNGTPTVGSTWGSIEQCVGIRLYFNKTTPNTGPVIGTTNNGYCGQIAKADRTQWWNVARQMAKALGAGAQANNVAAYITNASITQTGVGTASQTPVYQTSAMNMVSYAAADWANAETLSRFYTGSIDVAVLNPGSNDPGIGMRLFSTGATGGDQSLELFPSRINVANGSSPYTTGQPTPWPGGTVQVGSYSSVENDLFTRAQMQNFFVKVTNDNGSASNNDFAFDNLRLTDVTPSLYKSYANDRVAFAAGAPNTATLTFTVLNTTEQMKKEGWGFTETLPAGLTVAPGPAITNTCGATVAATPGTTGITVANGKLNTSTSLSSCVITVNVTAADAGVFTNAANATTQLKGLNAPAATQVEFYELKAMKTAKIGATALTNGTAVDAGSTIDYTLTFKNTNSRVAVINDNNLLPNWVAKSFIDELGDLLDDADLLGAGGVINNVTPLIGNTGWSGAPVIAYSQAQQRITVSGSIAAGQTATVTFSVKVKANTTDAVARQAGDASATPKRVGYRATNYLVETGKTLPATCVATSTACTTSPLRAYTIEKNSLPIDGAVVSSGANVYYRVKVTNFSGQNLRDIQIVDDMTSAMFAGYFDQGAPLVVPGTAYGISYYRADNSLITGETINWTAATGPKPVFSVANPPFNTDFPSIAPGFPNGEPFVGTWTLTTPKFNLPAKFGSDEVAYAVVGYAMKVGQIADPANAAQPFQYAGAGVSAAPNAYWVNTATAATTAQIEGPTNTWTNLEANRCRVIDGIAPGWSSSNNSMQFADCKTRHSLQASFFHLWKQGTAPDPAHPGQVESNLTGSSFVLADSKTQAELGQASRWLCRVNNNPGTLANPNPSYRAPGSDPALGVSGAEDFGFGSPTYAAIDAWNAGLFAWNAANPSNQRTARATCGLFYQHTAGADTDGQAVGSWHAQNIRGGDEGTLNNDWRANSALNVSGNSALGRHGTYWVVETKSPTNHQLLAQPFQLWVAPVTPTPGGLSSGTWDWYNYQGRLSMPVVGAGEPAADPSWGYGPASGQTGPRIREMCVNPWVLPAHNQPNCVMPTGWTMPIFDVKLKPLPLTGSLGTWWLVGGGAVLVAAILGVGLWRRRRSDEAAPAARGVHAAGPGDPPPALGRRRE